MDVVGSMGEASLRAACLALSSMVSSVVNGELRFLAWTLLIQARVLWFSNFLARLTLPLMVLKQIGRLESCYLMRNIFGACETVVFG